MNMKQLHMYTIHVDTAAKSNKPNLVIYRQISQLYVQYKIIRNKWYIYDNKHKINLKLK